RALEHEDRLFLPGVRVHDGGLSRLVAGDLGPELIGLKSIFRTRVSGAKALSAWRSKTCATPVLVAATLTSSSMGASSWVGPSVLRRRDSREAASDAGRPDRLDP